jgi:phage shock protein E
LDAWKAEYEATPNAFLLDVRSPQEFEAGHIPNATLIPVTQVAERAEELPEDKETPIFVYCRTGNRSTQAAATLDELGYVNVVNMNPGGFPDWARAGYPVAGA